MSKIAIITDSNSGITQAQAKELGIFVIPTPFMINDETYFEDISLTREEFYAKLGEDEPISTSQPSPADTVKLWEELLQDRHLPNPQTPAGVGGVKAHGDPWLGHGGPWKPRHPEAGPPSTYPPQVLLGLGGQVREN